MSINSKETRSITITDAHLEAVGAEDAAQLSMWLDEEVEECDVLAAISEDGYSKLFEPKDADMQELTQSDKVAISKDLARESRARHYESSEYKKDDLVQKILDLEDDLAAAQQVATSRVLASAVAQKAARSKTQEKADFLKYLGFVQMLNDAQKAWFKRPHKLISSTSPWDAIEYQRNGKVVTLSFTPEAFSAVGVSCNWAYKVWQGLASEKGLKSYRNCGLHITLP